MIRQAIIVSCGFFMNTILAQELPKIITSKTNYLPDFSYAGYHFGERQLPESNGKIINAADFGVKANDNLDDSKALLKALKTANASKEESLMIGDSFEADKPKDPVAWSVGDVVADGVQLIGDGVEAGQGNIEAHGVSTFCNL